MSTERDYGRGRSDSQESPISIFLDEIIRILSRRKALPLLVPLPILLLPCAIPSLNSSPFPFPIRSIHSIRAVFRSGDLGGRLRNVVERRGGRRSEFTLL